MERVKSPPLISLGKKKMDIPGLEDPGNLDMVTFSDWKARWNDYVTMTRVYQEVPDVAGRQAVLRSALSNEWSILWSAGRLDIKTTDDIDAVVDKLQAYVRARRNPLLDRKAFHSRDQDAGESIDQYVSALVRIDRACAYEELTLCVHCRQPCGHAATLRDARIRDRLINGLDKKMQQRVLEEDFNDRLDLDRVVKICRSLESSKETESQLTSEYRALNAARRSAYKKLTRPSGGRERCEFCGARKHLTEDSCPALTRKCHKCQTMGHFAVVCHRHAQKESIESNLPTKALGYVALNQTGALQAEHLVPVTLWHGSDVSTETSWLPDSGAEVDALTERDFAKLHPLPKVMTPDKDKVVAANGGSLDSVGVFRAKLELGGNSCGTTIHVFRNLSVSLLSKASCIQLGLLDQGWPQSRVRQISSLSLSTHVTESRITAPLPKSRDLETVKNSLLERYSEAFKEEPFKAMQGPPMHIELEDSAVPCRHLKPRSIPFRWRAAVHNQLESMLEKNIIEKVPVGEPYHWCHPMVIVPKKDSSEPRITVDLTGLNKYVRRPAHPTRVPREVVASIPRGMKYFTTMDSRHGYWQVPLDQESSKLTTFMTPWGAYRFKRNVMGLISAGDEHNRRGDDALAGVDNVVKVVEDVLVFDADLDSHIARVQEVLHRCSRAGITLHPKKFVFGASTVDYCGFTVGEHGYTISSRLVDALTKFPTPLNKTDVRSFCGLAQQFEPFTPQLSELLEPLRPLTCSSSTFVWEEPHQRAFDRTIQELSDQRVLAN